MDPLTLWVTNIRELLVAFAWPGALILVVVVLREPLSDVLRALASLPGRLKSVGKGVAEFEPDQLLASGDHGSNLEALLDQQRESLHPDLKAHLVRLDEEATRLIDESTHGDQIRARALERDTLVRAATRIAFDAVYDSIFRSQLIAMRGLRGRGGKAPVEILRESYELGKAEQPDFYREYSQESWTEYLVTSNLVTISEGEVELSDLGKAFLAYVDLEAARLKPENKHF